MADLMVRRLMVVNDQYVKLSVGKYTYLYFANQNIIDKFNWLFTKSQWLALNYLKKNSEKCEKVEV